MKSIYLVQRLKAPWLVYHVSDFIHSFKHPLLQHRQILGPKPVLLEPDNTEHSDSGYQVHGTERKISHLLYMDDLKLLGRNENDLENEIKLCKQLAKI
jgi:hypothetical protein